MRFAYADRSWENHTMAIAVSLDSLEDLIGFVKSDLRRNLSMEEICQLLAQTRLCIDDFDPYIISEKERYHRELVEKTDFASLLILTWLSGQESPIHDHGESQCGVRVVTGEMSEFLYEPMAAKQDLVRRTATHVWQPGVVTSSEQGIGIHKVGNYAPGKTLVTLHLYSPPLLKMKTYIEVNTSK